MRGEDCGDGDAVPRPELVAEDSEHLAGARAVAQWLEEDPRVSFVTWAGLESHPHHERAKKYLPLGPGSVFAFGVRPTGGFSSDEEEAAAARATGEAVIANLQLASHLANIGDARTLVIHPASTTHLQVGAEALAAAGVGEDMIRLSVGLEDAADIMEDLGRALHRAQQA